MDDYTAYVNPYFVVQKGKFTKHYFEGSSRIVSKLGEGTFVHKNTGIMAGGIDYIRQNAQMQEARDNYIRGLKVPPGPPTQHGIYASPEWTGQPYPSLGWQNIRQDQEPPEGWPRPPKFNEPGDVPGPPVQYGDPITPQTVKAGYGFVPNGIREKNLYYYHPDHLGSSSYITDRAGRITQHTEYIAFGEVLFEEHSTSKTMRYLFNGKELDSETGLYYYGARYYDPRVSLWLNVDPLAEKTMTPYAYTNNNPIRFIDPTGMEAEDACPNCKDGKYKIQKGDTFKSLEKKWNMLAGSLQKMNPNTSNVKEGQIINTIFNKDTLPSGITLHSNNSIKGMDGFFSLGAEGVNKIIYITKERYDRFVRNLAAGSDGSIGENSTGGTLDAKKYFLTNKNQYSTDTSGWFKNQNSITEPNTRALFVYKGIGYNINEFGNLAFGSAHAIKGVWSLPTLISGGNIYSILSNGNMDDKNEVRAVERGYLYYGTKTETTYIIP